MWQLGVRGIAGTASSFDPGGADVAEQTLRAGPRCSASACSGANSPTTHACSGWRRTTGRPGPTSDQRRHLDRGRVVIGRLADRLIRLRFRARAAVLAVLWPSLYAGGYLDGHRDGYRAGRRSGAAQEQNRAREDGYRAAHRDARRGQFRLVVNPDPRR
jgi:hypothetical protein